MSSVFSGWEPFPTMGSDITLLVPHRLPYQLRLPRVGGALFGCATSPVLLSLRLIGVTATVAPRLKLGYFVVNQPSNLNIV